MISGFVIGGKTAAEVGLYVAVAPFAVTAALFVLTVFGAPFFISKTLQRLGAILLLGGLASWLFGATALALYLAALASAWLLLDGCRPLKYTHTDILPSAEKRNRAVAENRTYVLINTGGYLFT